MPPDSALTRFIKSKWDFILGFGGPIIGLAFEFTSNKPITRLSIFLISLSIAFLLTNIVMTIVFRLADRMFGAIGSLTNLVEGNFSISKEQTEIAKELFKITEAHTRILEELNKPVSESTSTSNN